MGKTGVPYDVCMVEEAENILGKYKVAVFPFSLPSECGKRAMALCEKMSIPYLTTTEEHYELTVDEICEFYKSNGVHFYSDERDVVYVGNGFAGLHSAIGGTKQIKLPSVCRVTPIFGADIQAQTTDIISFELIENGTALFSIEKIVKLD
jgi:hypothetical protein